MIKLNLDSMQHSSQDSHESPVPSDKLFNANTTTRMELLKKWENKFASQNRSFGDSKNKQLNSEMLASNNEQDWNFLEKT